MVIFVLLNSISFIQICQKFQVPLTSNFRISPHRFHSRTIPPLPVLYASYISSHFILLFHPLSTLSSLFSSSEFTANKTTTNIVVTCHIHKQPYSHASLFISFINHMIIFILQKKTNRLFILNYFFMSSSHCILLLSLFLNTHGNNADFDIFT